MKLMSTGILGLLVESHGKTVLVAAPKKEPWKGGGNDDHGLVIESGNQKIEKKN